ncbi:phosphopantetheine-binding protein [Cysteiniphilum halobium]|uniref:phosphopantetheine-binding protein n=1 Tax=Cysteiniphilum halobium TaxID=2219059 RepID=UPI000E65CD5F|nr:phosphopantetheine-binding protein [Cysteiniphilum halobium]
MSNALLELELKELIINVLNLEDITIEDIASDMQLFGNELGLDSIDALELGVALKKKYNIELSEETDDVKKHFESVKTLAQFIAAQNNKE